jgi:hypothetical protein
MRVGWNMFNYSPARNGQICHNILNYIDFIVIQVTSIRVNCVVNLQLAAVKNKGTISLIFTCAPNAEGSALTHFPHALHPQGN